MTPAKTLCPNRAMSDVWAEFGGRPFTSRHVSSWNVGFYYLGGQDASPRCWAMPTLRPPRPPQPHKTPASPAGGAGSRAGAFNRQTGYHLTP